jgi:hypothetical protein
VRVHENSEAEKVTTRLIAPREISSFKTYMGRRNIASSGDSAELLFRERCA